MTADPGRPCGARLLAALPAGEREPLASLARTVDMPAGTRVFEEGGEADRFWILCSGTVDLDIEIPGRGRTVVETIGADGLLGWSWLCPPRQWHLGAETREAVRAWQFDATAVRALCAERPALGLALVTLVAETIGERLRATRTRLIDLYGPPENGPTP
ncbi:MULTISPECIES: cyclic nucleotide-binding domain-containing protein [Streptomyces]|uniref:cyclic nucleotide-binding domain-containing protein n=1 Tax=Streptomyces TaxID=1883 RepID=UPI002DBAEECE|nr:cyclic nucleotide-binding domain-containing protein [Streptomyces sp. CMAA1738]MEC4570183.1 cyclic nucleotide-binding domain-containing protein [Streptomyces sp. CMAA1738]